jgi:hypothetical protein
MLRAASRTPSSNLDTAPIACTFFEQQRFLID